MNNRKPLVSIIVPVYNLEKVVPRCLNSLLAQTYNDIEIIVVDDGSKDASLDICKEYSKKDPRVTVMSKENGGVSSARNLGLDNTRGEYIVFVDSDDFVLPTYIESIVNGFAISNADIVVTRMASGDDSGNNYHVSHEVSISGNYTSLDFEKLLYTCKNWYEHSMIISVWGKGYKKDIFNSIRFEGRISEDYAFTDIVNSRNYRITVIDEIGYIYCYSPNSLTNKTTVSERMGYLEVLEKRLQLFANDNFIVNNTCKLYCNMYVEYYYAAAKSERSQLKKYKKQFDSCIRTLRLNHLNDKKFFLRLTIFRLSPLLYGIITSSYSK